MDRMITITEKNQQEDDGMRRQGYGGLRNRDTEDEEDKKKDRN